VDSTSGRGSERARAQLQGVTNRRAHHIEENSMILVEEESKEKEFWVFFVGPRAPFLSLSGRVFFVLLFIGLNTSWEERGCTADRGINLLEVQIFFIQLETLSGGF
jgi:hypothetical protein